MKNSSVCIIYAALNLIGLLYTGDSVFLVCLVVSAGSSSVCSAIEDKEK